GPDRQADRMYQPQQVGALSLKRRFHGRAWSAPGRNTPASSAGARGQRASHSNCTGNRRGGEMEPSTLGVQGPDGPATESTPDGSAAHGPGDLADREWAICCSGGGIRSAAYCLGALQSLDSGGLMAKVKWILGVS